MLKALNKNKKAVWPYHKLEKQHKELLIPTESIVMIGAIIVDIKEIASYASGIGAQSHMHRNLK